MTAAARLGAEVVVGSEEAQAMAASMGDRSVVVPLGDPVEAVQLLKPVQGSTARSSVAS